MSEENQKVDKRRLVSNQRLLNLQKMREAKAAKAEERKKSVGVEPKIEPEIPNVPNQEVEEVSEDEVPIPKSKKKTTKEIQPLYGLQDEIQRYVEACLPPEFSKENRKKQKWQMRKEEIKKEILQSLKPSATTPQPAKEPQKNEKTATLDISDLFF